MVADGEGATKTLTVDVTGRATTAQARTIARAIVNSNLVQTALYGEDPNWGRIIAAAGSVNAGLDPRYAGRLYLNGKTWVERGAIEVLSEAEAHSELEVATDARRARARPRRRPRRPPGAATSRSDYVRINANYRT